MNDTGKTCKDSILAMLKNSQTKVIFPIIAYGLLLEYQKSGKDEFKDSEVRQAYFAAVSIIQKFVGHKLHTGGKYYDAYPIRNLPRYGFLVVHEKIFQITPLFKDNAVNLIDWIPSAIENHIKSKLGIIPTLGDDAERLSIAANIPWFQNFISENIVTNPANFEVFSFAIIKIHLEKFACKIYRDTRTASHDKGVDLSTNFGVVYQIKKLQLLNQRNAEEILSELKVNFDSERMNDRKIVLIIDDISKDVKNYLINMKVQSISKDDIISICRQFSEVEDRMKVLRVIYDEFRRDYESLI
jgi:hypothetical protein